MDTTVEATPAAAPLIEKTPLERYVAPEKPSLVGLTRRAARRRARQPSGCRRGQRKMRVQQLWHWIYFRGLTSFDAMTSVSKDLRAALRAALHPGAPRGRRRAGLGRRHAQVAFALAGRTSGRAPARSRMRLHPRHRARHALRLQPGRLHAQLHLLPHRHPAPGAQPHRRRDRRPGAGGARPARRLAGRRRAPPTAWCRPANAASPTS